MKSIFSIFCFLSIKEYNLNPNTAPSKIIQEIEEKKDNLTKINKKLSYISILKISFVKKTFV